MLSQTFGVKVTNHHKKAQKLSSQPNYSDESGLHSSLHEHCHHKIIYLKFNLKIYFPPPYEREIWHYQETNIKNIQKAIYQFPWAMRFTNIYVNEKLNLFNKTIKDIIQNYIPHETITCDDGDSP